MDLQTWGFAISVLTLIGGLVRWLVGYWWKSQRELIDIKASHAASAFRNLNETVDDHKKNLYDISRRLTGLESELKLAIAKFDSIKHQIDSFGKSFTDFTDKADKKFNNIFSEHVKLAKELTMVKSKKL